MTAVPLVQRDLRASSAPRAADARPSRPGWRDGALGCAAWGVYAALAASRFHDATTVGWPRAAMLGAADACLWVPLVALAVQLARRHASGTTRPATRVVPYAAALAVAVVWRAGAAAALAWSGTGLDTAAAAVSDVARLATDALLFVLAVALAHGIDEARRARRLETALAEARLAALAMQLRPHFLLNALNTAAELVYRDAPTADRVLTALGQLLWHSLRHDGLRSVALHEELALLRHYVEVERARFGDRLAVEWLVAPETLGARVPALLLQPLVENAVRHGIAPRETCGIVRVVASREEDTLRLVVADDGVGFGRTSALRDDGVGLANVRARLQMLYGARHSVEIASHVDRGTVVTIRLPWSVAHASGHAAPAPERLVARR